MQRLLCGGELLLHAGYVQLQLLAALLRLRRALVQALRKRVNVTRGAQVAAQTHGVAVGRHLLGDAAVHFGACAAVPEGAA